MKLKIITTIGLAALLFSAAGCYEEDFTPYGSSYPSYGYPVYGGGRTVYKNVYKDDDHDGFHGHEFHGHGGREVYVNKDVHKNITVNRGHHR